MKILYLSVLISPTALQEVHLKDQTFSSYAVQKFHSLLVRGLAKNGAKVKSLSTFYLPNVGKGFYRRSEAYDGISYSYIPTPNCSYLRHLWLSFFCFVRVLCFGFFRKKNKVIICDVLNISACIGAVFAAKLIGLRRIGIVTDMPEFVVNGNHKYEKKRNRKSFAAFLNMRFLSSFTHYIFLTEQMNVKINVKKRPYVIVEGLVDSSFLGEKATKNKNKIVIYAGGLDERYGLRLLLEGFISANVPRSELHLFGDGPFAPEIRKYSELYSNIYFGGIQPNEIIVKKEQEASLLVNPRPTKEVFTKYSFPSKNMEYMLSGTPVLTTKLPGMPQEYYPYVFLFDDESVNGYARSIRDVLSMPDILLNQKGEQAQKWVMVQKNNITQAKKVIELISR